MSIRFPKWCKTRGERSTFASAVASLGWKRRREARPDPVWIGYIEFGGPLSADCPMRLDLYAEDGARKWLAVSDRQILPQRLSLRSILRLVKTILLTPRTTTSHLPPTTSSTLHPPPSTFHPSRMPYKARPESPMSQDGFRRMTILPRFADSSGANLRHPHDNHDKEMTP